MKKILLPVVVSLGVSSVVQLSAQAMDHQHQMTGQDAMGAMAQGEASDGTAGEGVINAVDRANRSVNITHDPIPALSWPGMTMDLPVTEGVDLASVKPGEKVDFKLMLGADNVYRITEMTKRE